MRSREKFSNSTEASKDLKLWTRTTRVNSRHDGTFKEQPCAGYLASCEVMKKDECLLHSSVLTQAQSDTDFKPLKSELFHQLYNFIDSPFISFIKRTEGVVQIVGIVKPTEVLYLQKHLIHLFNFFPPSLVDVTFTENNSALIQH